ncbi:hypothetical protein PAP_06925 [Palaeococcus pacificus DY20341]|uniref:Uncharacterized protein n=1 Tax=Palaeococcus pacificus DY20341 TaxID=1343739 RepID=A0A075LTT1_9EURY|nr:CGP-CTERM sorting domain-containing protein [Palaeococcus pacificus]AIF69779.1 hypothetical protein PAP_06925 [Palaeococcus pacificus DY20341]
MRKVLAGLLVFALFFGAGLVKAEYSEKFEATYKIMENGDANITFITTWLAPEEDINKTKELILNMSVENATNAMLFQENKKLEQAGMYLINGTLELKNYDSEGPLIKILHGKFIGLAKYYSYDDTWELDIDVLRLLDLSYAYQNGAPQEDLTLDSYFTIELPEGAKDITVPESLERAANGNEVKLESTVEGTTVNIHTFIKIKANTSIDELASLLQDYTLLPITYKGFKGEESYETWNGERIVKLGVHKDYVELNTTDRLMSPPTYLIQAKMQILQMGLENATELLKQQSLYQFQIQGVTVKDGNLTITGIRGNEPLEISAHWILQNFTKQVDGVYEYPYAPNFGINPATLGRRFTYELTQSSLVEITLVDGGEFVELPENISKEVNGNRLELKVYKEGNKVILNNTIFIRYGATREDITKLVEDVPTEVFVKYKLSEEKTGVCGPAAIVALALVPLLILRRRY